MGSESGWPVWSKHETHCAACTRPFATDTEEDRHAEQECIKPECWCEAFCWASQGGECDCTDLPLDDDLSLASIIRALAERLPPFPSPHPKGTQ